MRPTRTLIAAGALTLALAGCASADKTGQNAADTSAGASNANVSSASASSSGSAIGSSGSATGSSTGSGSGSSMGSSTMSASAEKAMNNGAVTAAIPTRTIATGYWKDMKIVAQERTAVPFYVYNGTSYTELKPTKQTSFHLMVMLNDRTTGEALPYATVWASLSKNGKTVFNERQWPMLSEYMGPHYGNNVTLPGPGTYQLKLLVSAPVAALHVEYAHMWVGTHTVTSTFTWK
jgi:hypothetical protein